MSDEFVTRRLKISEPKLQLPVSHTCTQIRALPQIRICQPCFNLRPRRSFPSIALRAGHEMIYLCSSRSSLLGAGDNDFMIVDEPMAMLVENMDIRRWPVGARTLPLELRPRKKKGGGGGVQAAMMLDELVL